MRTKLDQMLEAMNVELVDMGRMCQEAISCAIQGMLSGDEDMTQKAFIMERALDEKEGRLSGCVWSSCSASSRWPRTCGLSLWP